MQYGHKNVRDDPCRKFKCQLEFEHFIMAQLKEPQT